ncbi:MAG TPA: cob(I)yrinic acid a,c-diamide adenosyltransferase [Phycisphaerae bacterium]|nr:cob(I)yrinic acid a,c-diamide adenosyltransferase [Phycisphaerae bacterium]
MKLYTKKGDGGQTQLGDRSTVTKDHPRVAAYGEVDELNACVGLAAAACDDAAWSGRLRRVQDRLFVVGAELADPSRGPQTPTLDDRDITALEGWIDEASGAVAPLKNFVLPGGSELAARLHLARTVCRRAERSVVRLSGDEQADTRAVVFLNRLGDLLFAWARLANHRRGVEDVLWRPRGDSKDS